MRGSTKPSLPRSGSSLRPPAPAWPIHEGAQPVGPAVVAQPAASHFVVLGHASLYPLRLCDEPLAGRGGRGASPAARGRRQFHPRLLARATDDDPDGVATP